MIIYILILQLAKKDIKFQLYYYNVISSMILINFTCVIKRKVIDAHMLKAVKKTR